MRRRQSDIVDEGSASLKELYRRFSKSVVAVVSVDAQGDQHIGSAFHVGDGSFVSARHVFDGQKNCRVAISSERGLEQGWKQIAGKFLPDESKDVAVFAVPELSHLPAIPLGDHLDDWVRDDAFVLNDVLVMGYPPIPLSRRSVLVAAVGQVNAVVDLININHVHFVVSVLPRGGFSGGVVLSEWGFALGVVTSSLVKNQAPEELGYLTVLTVEPILQCLATHDCLPRSVAEFWDGLFTSKTWHFGKPDKRWGQAFIETDRDGNRTCLKFACPLDAAISEAIQAVKKATRGIETSFRIVPKEVHEVNFIGNYSQLEKALLRASDAVAEVFAQHGFAFVESPTIISRTLEEPGLLRPKDQSERL